MPAILDEDIFRKRVDACVQRVRQVLEFHRSKPLAVVDSVPHQYDDKYILANVLTSTTGVCAVNSLKCIGLKPSLLKTLREWNKSKNVSLRFDSRESFTFLDEIKMDVDSCGKCVNEEFSKADGSRITASKLSSTITEYQYQFNNHYQLVAFRGIGNDDGDRITVQTRQAEHICVLRAKIPPHPEESSRCYDVNISWLIHNLSDNCEQMTFNIDRAHKDCHTPRRNKEIDSSVTFFSDLFQWCKQVCVHFNPTDRVSNTSIDLTNMLSEIIFVPMLPFMHDFIGDMSECVVDTLLSLSENASASKDATETPARGVSRTGIMASVLAITHTDATINVLLHEHERSLLAKCSEIESAYADPSNSTEVITSAETKIAVICSHICDIVAHYFDGINFIEELIRKQLVSAVGKELQPSDFSAYIQFHNRKLLRAEYQPKPFTHSVRRSVAHSPEGTVCIVDASDSGSDSVTDAPEPTHTLCHRVVSSPNNKMEFRLDASTTIKFGGDRHVHGWLGHSFSGQSLPQLNLVAQARQFSSFIVLVGSIASGTVFEPKHALIVQNKDEVVIPLLLETLPTPKQFRVAIESLSPEQQRFAKAFRSMQLESTLFGVCVIQIKPQLEKVLNLAPDSLTKEIQLTQDLMKLFIEYQIPTDLMSFEGDRGASAATRLEAVRGHVKALNDIVDRAKEEEERSPLEVNEFSRAFSASSTLQYFSKSVPYVPAPRRTPPQASTEKMMQNGFAGMTLRYFSSTHTTGGLQSSEHSSVVEEVDSPTSSSTVDFTRIPHLLEQRYEKYDCDSALKPSIIKVGKAWTKRSQAALLAKAASKILFTWSVC